MVAQPIVFIVGTTASGKSDAAMKLAERLPIEIVCADSQTVRKELNIGTAKPSIEEQQAVPHHGLDLIEPYERFSVSAFKIYAESAIKDIISRGNIPVVVGGSGLYIDALYYDYPLQDEQADDDLEEKSVAELQEIINGQGYPMPENNTNPRHLIGVIRRKGVVHDSTTPREGAIITGMRRSEEKLKQRIQTRVSTMVEHGLVSEVVQIISKHGPPPEKFDAIAYPLVTKYLDGEIDMEDLQQQFARADWQYARRQNAWFKRNKNIAWFEQANELVEHIVNAMGEKSA